MTTGQQTGPDTTSAAVRPSASTVDMVVLALPLLIAAVNPGTGYLSGMYAAIAVAVYALVRRCMLARLDLRRLIGELSLVDLIAVVSAAYVLVSPLWAYDSLSWSASRGAVASIAYFVSVRWLVRSRADFRRLAQIIAWLCLVYAVVFLLTAQQLDPATSRRSVDFANANYTAAVLAYGAVVSLYFAVVEQAAATKVRVLWAIAFLVEAWATLGTGSRASFAGVGAALVILLVGRLVARWAYLGALVLLTAGFLVGFVPVADGLFQGAADTLQQTSVGSFTRSDAAMEDLSGRQEIWVSTRRVIAENPLFGSGLEGYRLRGDVPILAHSWGMEYVASIGVLGTIPVAWLIFASYLNRGVGAITRLGRNGWLWNGATALALLPNLVLSTHQWTLWAWAGFALWSRAHLLDDTAPTPAPLVGTGGTE